MIAREGPAPLNKEVCMKEVVGGFVSNGEKGTADMTGSETKGG